jgi:predicted DNA-binding transcriptional regulator AlpA
MPKKPAAQRSLHDHISGTNKTDAAPPAPAAVHHRGGDRDSGDDDDAAARPSLLPVYVRFRDIRAAGIAKNWPTLSRLIDEEGFPRGVMLSPNMRAWLLTEVQDWLATRPVERKPTPNRWAMQRQRSDGAAESTSSS